MDSILNPVAFVKAKNEDEHYRNDYDRTKKKQTKASSSESEGKDTKEFYESIIGKSDEVSPFTGENVASASGSTFAQPAKQKQLVSSDKSGHKKSSSRHSLDSSEQTVPLNLEAQGIRTRAEVDLNARLGKGSSDFLRCAQEGDLDVLKLHLERGMDINIQDSYGWTAVMCAAHAGHAELLQFLLEKGANVYLVDNQGNNVRSIAESVKPKNKEICQMIKDFMDGKSDWQIFKKTVAVKYEIFYCEKCKREFSDITREKHETSTIHLFNAKPKERSTFYHLPESNKGFKLLVQGGWDKEKGLGPEGKGNKFPVKTVLKRDRMGLGNPTSSGAKITHFAPHDTDAVKRPKLENGLKKERTLRKSTVSKRQRAKQLSKDQQKELNFRLAFNTDN